MKKILKNKNGTTLLEMIVAISLFAMVMIASTNIYQSVIKGQRSAISSQNIQESMRFMLEIMNKEIRQADVNDGSCNPVVVVNAIYDDYNKEDSEALFFLNKNGECVEYYAQNGFLMKDVDGTIGSTTPDEVFIDELEFVIDDQDSSPENKVQSRVTIKMKVRNRISGGGVGDNEFTLQTTISSRRYY